MSETEPTRGGKCSAIYRDRHVCQRPDGHSGGHNSCGSCEGQEDCGLPNIHCQAPACQVILPTTEEALIATLTAQVAEQAQEIERLRREWEDAVERERRLAPSLADTQVMARDAQAKLRAVEALRDELLKMEAADIASADESPFAVGRQLVWPGGLIGRAHGYKNAAAKLTAILTEAQ